MLGIEVALTIWVIWVSGFIEAITSTIWKRAWRRHDRLLAGTRSSPQW